MEEECLWLAQTQVDFSGAWYHELNRGIEKRAIFRSRRCHEKFIEPLSSVPKRFGVRLHGYVPIGNQYHLQVETPEAMGRTLALPWQRCPRDCSFTWQKPWTTNLKELGKLPGGIHHNAVSIVIRRFSERAAKGSSAPS
jgi:hypothetical protein